MNFHWHKLKNLSLSVKNNYRFDMKKSLFISVIMNCYNGKIYFKESIKSLLLQTYKNWELIFWDNNSRKNSKNIVLRFKDKRIKYYLKFLGV